MNDKKESIKKMIERLHQGEDPLQLKDEFEKIMQGIDAMDIAYMEKELLKEGMKEEEIKKLCDVHLLVFENNLEAPKELNKNHPVSILAAEHQHILKFTETLGSVVQDLNQASAFNQVSEQLGRLEHIAQHLVEANLHHQREEEVLFPYLRRKGVGEPADIMLSEHGILKPAKRELLQLVKSYQDYSWLQFLQKLNRLAATITNMLPAHIYKEDHILYPLALKVVPGEAWKDMKHDFDRIGYCCFTPHQPAQQI